MAQDLALDYLIVMAHHEPPSPASVSRALASAGLGVFDYTPAPPPDDATAPPRGGRRRLGTYAATTPETQATARILAYRYDGPVTAGMDAPMFAELSHGLNAGDLRALKEGSVALDLRVSIPAGRALAGLGWTLRVLAVLLEQSEGTCIDLAAQRALGRSEVQRLNAADPLAHVHFHETAWDPETRWLHTHGLQKLGRPELELIAVPISLHEEGTALLHEVATSVAGGAQLTPGTEFDFGEQGAIVAIGSSPDVDHQAPFGRLTLADAPAPGEEQGSTATRFLTRTALLAVARRAEQGGDLAAALAEVDRVLAADPDDCAAMLIKVDLLLRSGEPAEALDLGEFMELVAPNDYRGPFAVGKALATLGRGREALNALSRAIRYEPEAVEVYAARAEVYERLGERQLAATDRAHVAYLARVAR
jgi:hypothetical protein